MRIENWLSFLSIAVLVVGGVVVGETTGEQEVPSAEYRVKNKSCNGHKCIAESAANSATTAIWRAQKISILSFSSLNFIGIGGDLALLPPYSPQKQCSVQCAKTRYGCEALLITVGGRVQHTVPLQEQPLSSFFKKNSILSSSKIQTLKRWAADPMAQKGVG